MIILKNIQDCHKDLTHIQKDNWKAYSITGHVGKLKTAKKYKRVELKLDEMLKILDSDEKIVRIDTLDTLSSKYKSLGTICE